MFEKYNIWTTRKKKTSINILYFIPLKYDDLTMCDIVIVNL